MNRLSVSEPPIEEAKYHLLLEWINGIIPFRVHDNPLSVMINLSRIERTKHCFDISHTNLAINLILQIQTFVHTNQIRLELIEVRNRVIVSLRWRDRNVGELEGDVCDLVTGIASDRCIIEADDILVESIFRHDIQNNVMNRIGAMGSGINRTNVLLDPNTLVILLIGHNIGECSIIQLCINIDTSL